MATCKFRNVILRLDGMSLPIKKITELLKGRKFDFSYKLANDGGVHETLNQTLNLSIFKPIRLETRIVGRRAKEFLVFFVDGPDDLLVSVSDWTGALDIEIKDDRDIMITNVEGDWYKISIIK